MPEIMLTPEVLTEKATELGNIQAEQQNVIEGIQKLVDDIVSGWEGQAQQKFVSSFEEKKSTYKEFSVDMTNFVDFLRVYSNTMQDIDNGQPNIG